jgi:hypothetical protein
LLQDLGFGAAMLWEAQLPISDGSDDTVTGVAGVVAAILALGRLDGFVGSSELLECWKLQPANAEKAANATRRHKTFFIDGCASDYRMQGGNALPSQAGDLGRNNPGQNERQLL